MIALRAEVDVAIRRIDIDGQHLLQGAGCSNGTWRASTTSRVGRFYSMEAVPGAAQQTSIQVGTRWFEEVERVVRR